MLGVPAEVIDGIALEGEFSLVDTFDVTLIDDSVIDDDFDCPLCELDLLHEERTKRANKQIKYFLFTRKVYTTHVKIKSQRFSLTFKTYAIFGYSS